MRSALRLGAGAGFALEAVTCRDDHRRWSPSEVSTAHRVVLVRRGRFRRKAGGRAATLDPTLAYLAAPGEEEHFAHPAGGDVCTSLHLSAPLWRTLAGDSRPRLTLYVDARLDLAHRRLLIASRAGDPAFELAEAMLRLIAAALSGAGPTPATPSRRFPAAGVRSSPAAIADAAREAIAAGHPAADGLLPLAAAGDLGFADQAHLTRTIRRHTGHPPAALRRLLTT
jgi:AraC-like DNA-binding protein